MTPPLNNYRYCAKILNFYCKNTLILLYLKLIKILLSSSKDLKELSISKNHSFACAYKYIYHYNITSVLILVGRLVNSQENKKNRQTRALTVTFCILSIKQIKLYVLYDGEQQARDVRF